MPTKFTLWLFLLSTASILLTGCTSTPEVRDLAKLTATNTSLVGTQLTQFSKDRHDVAEMRAKALADLSEEVERQQATFDTYLESARAAATISGDTKKANYATVIAELLRVSDAIQVRQQSISLKREAIYQEILNDQQSLTIPKTNLDTIAKHLGTLAEEPTRADQLKFLGKFFNDVYEDIKTAKKASEKASADSKSAVNNAKSNADHAN